MTPLDRPWIDDLLAALGARYKLGSLADGGGAELLFRAGKTEFRASRFLVGRGDGRGLELTLDVRVPRDAPPAAVEAILETFDARSARPRGFTKTGDATTKMTSEAGADSGVVRSLKYSRTGGTPIESAKEIRAMVETIDTPITIGIHDPEHVVARDPPPLRERKRQAVEALDLWEYELDRGLLASLTVVVDPNDRTLRVFRRKLLSREQVGEVVKLAHLSKLRLERKSGSANVVAVRRDGTEVALATGSGSPGFQATLARLSKKVMIPLEER